MPKIDDATLALWDDQSNRNRQLDPDEVEQMVEASRVPSVLIIKTITDETPGASGCWLGGDPTLPAHIEWPWVKSVPIPEELHDYYARNNKPLPKVGPLYPMHFFAQINLAEVPRAPGMIDLPLEGTLFFFADYVGNAEKNVRNPNYKIIYVKDDISDSPKQSQPQFPDDFDDSHMMYWWKKNPVKSFRHWPITFANFGIIHENRFPNDDYWTYALNKTIDEWDNMFRMADKSGHKKRGPWGTVPMPSGQRRREEKKQHHLLGIDTPPGYSGPYKPDTIRLLTLEHDSNLNFWHTGQIGFFIAFDDLAKRNFDAAWAFTESS
ncbi:DUF1963 domain-containing protein [Yoonia maritima]|uniref:DUF1963 domain-containing protein n=1 Tax=Yoonia maritima TaxID=1435347 RepID=UPI000D0E8A7E|nr:DUF1963 domain-containing protein [Yoonia maritima]